MTEHAGGGVLTAALIQSGLSGDAGVRWDRELELVRQWVFGVKGNTRAAYADGIGWPRRIADDSPRDVSTLRNGVTWLNWCWHRGVHLLDARRGHVLEWTEALREIPNRRNGQLLPRSTRAHTFTVASSLYACLAKTGYLEVNPMSLVDRAKLGVGMTKTEAQSRSLSEDEAARLLVAADHDPVEQVRLRSSVIVAWLLMIGTRVSEMLDIRVTKIRITQGVRVADVHLKGDRVHSFAIPDEVWSRLERYFASRGIGSAVALRGVTSAPPWLIATATGGRMARQNVNVTLSRLARIAGIEDPTRVTAHAGRHTLATAMREDGVDPSKIREHFAHRHQETTDRYGNHALNLANSPSRRVAARFEAAAAHLKLAGGWVEEALG